MTDWTEVVSCLPERYWSRVSAEMEAGHRTACKCINVLLQLSSYQVLRVAVAKPGDTCVIEGAASLLPSLT